MGLRSDTGDLVTHAGTINLSSIQFTLLTQRHSAPSTVLSRVPVQDNGKALNMRRLVSGDPTISRCHQNWLCLQPP